MKNRIIIIISMLFYQHSWAQQPPLFNFTTTNSSATFYGQVQINGLPASSNDWIAAFDASGNCCGASQLVVNSGSAYINLVIYGDDATTPSVDEGMDGNEDFTLKLYLASSGNYISYPSNSNSTYFSGWSNTNGAPLPVYNNPADVYNFQNTPNVSFNLNLSLCENDAPVILSGGQPVGGIYSGNSVNNGGFDPTTSGPGIHDVFYILNNDTATSSITVNALANANLISTGPYCENESAIVLNSVTTGGIYSGNGVINNTFNPDIVGAGSYWISYYLTDSNNCTQILQTLIEVNPSTQQPTITQNANTLICNIFASSYQWYDANLNPISGANSQNYNPITDGNYYVEVSNGLCNELSNVYQFFSVTDISEYNLDISINLSDEIIINTDTSLDYIYMFDVSGKKLFSQKVNATKVYIPINAKEGIYILKLVKGNSIESIKLNL